MFLIRKIFTKNCVLSLGWRHSVKPRNLSPQTREKVCVWCVFESHTHSVSVQKLSHWYCFGKWCPGAESHHWHEDFQCRWCNLYIYKQWLACQYFWCACKCVFSVILRVGQKHCVGHGNRKISVLTHCSTLQKTQDWTGTKWSGRSLGLLFMAGVRT